MKILHTADIHLGDLTGPVRDGKNARRQDTIACMKYIAQRAATETPNVTIIAGDLFNRSRVWADTALDDVNDAITEFIRPLCRSSEHVVLLFGTENHDNPRAFETVREITKDEKNLHIYTAPGVEKLTTSAGPVQILALPGFDKGRLRLFCPGADKETENRNATALINDVLLGLSTELDKSIPSILVAHYTVAGSEADNGSTFLAGQDVVILPSTIDSTGVDLACFGHIHRPQKLPCNTPAYYCGSPNQLNFNDEGVKHGFWLHRIYTSPVGEPGTAVETKFDQTPERQHYTYRMGPEDVTAFTASGELPEAPEPLKDAIVRVRYNCTAEQEKALNKADLQKKLLAAGAFYVAEVLPEDVEDVAGESEVTEHEGPTEALERYLKKLEVTPEEAARLNQSSQVFALLYLNKLDHLMKEGFRFRYYGRYMDDFYIIHESKDTLRAAWKAISEHLAERGLELNDKTQIFPLRNGLDFLGFHSYLTDTGKVVRKLRRASRERMKRKLRKYKVMYESGAITKEKITESYQSWRSHASHGDCHALIQKYDQLYNEIFERSETADVSINQRPAR